ncbi:Histone acetyltransferase HPA2-like protein [Oceanococcus atlanticus]|uniref:Histone acetyltransferase HPA2-like protein n=1 Tax=Oceanococcus atlanticus TaxID=1317117 RepID=A0A1Y1SGY9_9GAMM|nr:GNAT family N-acetyltransferase [Oceanococcus atlanticus]ORE88459.1 Histone acetyltransferase HPA2-like protein [Oceanococcus atlanticus]
MPRPLSKIRLLRPASTPDWQAYQALRWAILRAPWLPGQSPQIEPQGAAADVDHVIAKNDTNEVVGCGRIHWLGQGRAQIRAMAVATAYQGSGLGRMIMQHLETLARGRGVDMLILQAREHSIAFYQRCGFQVTGPGETLFGTIDHQWMSKALDCHDFSGFELKRRAATDSDATLLADFVFEILASYGLAPERDGIDRDLERPASHYAGGFFDLLFDHDNTLAASCALLSQGDGQAELRRMYLAPAWRGRGLGRACLGHALAWARTHGFDTISLETASVLTEARALYQWAGFTPQPGHMAAQRCDLRLVLSNA